MNNKIYVLMEGYHEHHSDALGYYASLEAAKEALLKKYQDTKDWHDYKQEDDCIWVASAPDPVWEEKEHWYSSRSTDRVWRIINTWTFYNPLDPEYRTHDPFPVDTYWIESVDLL